MGGRTVPEDDWIEPERPYPIAAGLTLAVVWLLVLLSNGRPIDAGDTRATEHVAKSLVERGRLDLDAEAEVEPPFAKMVGEHRVSIYPVLSAVLAAPVFALCRPFFALDETGLALAGKIAASLFSVTAAVLLFLTLARRHGEATAAAAATFFVLGTSVWSTSQALWQHPAAVLFLAWSLLWFERAQGNAVWAGRAGLPLGLALAARHADIALVGCFALGILVVYPKQTLRLLLWALPGVAFVFWYDSTYFGSPLATGFSGALGKFSEPWGRGHLGLLVSPGKGLLVFTPLSLVALVGLGRAFSRGERGLSLVLGGACFAHLLLMGRWSDWHGGECFGPRMMTDAIPFLSFFLPEGLEVLGKGGMLLAGLSVLAQGIGAFAFDDYRWERLYQRPPAPDHAELWSLEKSPLFYYAKRRVLIPAVPIVEQGRVFIRTSPFVLLSPKGSRIRFSEDDLRVSGVDATLQDAYLLQGARVSNGRLAMKGRWDGVFFRLVPPARNRSLELRLVGTGQGFLYVGEKTFWSPAPRWTAHAVSGNFRIVQPYFFPESGGDGIVVTVGKGGGEASLGLVALVPKGEPDQPIEAP